MARRTLKGLSCDAVDAEPRHVDWSDAPNADYDDSADNAKQRLAWRAWEAQRCETCGAVLVLTTGEGGESHRAMADRHDDEDERDKARECEGYIGLSEGPMMNTFWPADFRPLSCEDAAARIADVPLCVVELDGETGFALTGGGMDLSWEIAHAYMLAGMYPPVSVRLPAMASRFGPRERWIVAGMRASYRIKARWMAQRLKDLRDLVAWYTERAQASATGRNGAQAQK